MATTTPSYVAKLSRAEKHLIDLETEIDRYPSTEPYTVEEGVEGKRERKVHRLAFTAEPANTDIPMTAADVLYNLRSCLDGLKCADPADAACRAQASCQRDLALLLGADLVLWAHGARVDVTPALYHAIIAPAHRPGVQNG